MKKSYKARNFQQTIDNVSPKTFLQIVDNHKLKNCPITREHVRVAEDILSPNIQSLQGNTSRKTPSAVGPPKVSSLPTFTKLKYVTVIICADIMFVNRVQFFMTISQHIRFRASEHITNSNTATLLQYLLQVNHLYKRRGFKFQTVMMDGQFEPIKADADNAVIAVNITSRDEHKPVIERYIRTIKDRSRSV